MTDPHNVELTEVAWRSSPATMARRSHSTVPGTTRMNATPEHRPATQRSWKHDAMASDGEVTWSHAPGACRLFSSPPRSAAWARGSDPGADAAIADVEQR